MKKWLLLALVAALSASPAFAYVQSGHMTKIPKASERAVDETGEQPDAQDRPMVTDPAPPGPREAGEEPAMPVPEPGTMALASMGLLALGVAARKRRGS